MDLANRLREAISTCHGAIEELPVSKAMFHGTVGRDDYAALLGQLWHIHAALEDELAQADHLRGIYRPEMARRDVIASDLAALGCTPAEHASDEATAAAATVREWAASSPWALLGALYVLEGSRMGSMVLVKPVARALGVPVEPGQGVDYHLDGLTQRPRMWQQFKAGLLALTLTDDQADDVAKGATGTMHALYELYAVAGAQPVGA